jgi:hypothetical protein
MIVFYVWDWTSFTLFCETYLILFLSFFGLKMFHQEPSASSLRVIGILRLIIMSMEKHFSEVEMMVMALGETC